MAGVASPAVEAPALRSLMLVLLSFCGPDVRHAHAFDVMWLKAAFCVFESQFCPCGDIHWPVRPRATQLRCNRLATFGCSSDDADCLKPQRFGVQCFQLQSDECMQLVTLSQCFIAWCQLSCQGRDTSDKYK